MRTISKSEAVKKQIIRGIHLGNWPPGCALSSIEALAKKYGVSKNTVSIALAGLNDAGIIRLEHGKATRVCSQPFRRHIEIITYGQFPVANDHFWGEFNRGAVDELAGREDITCHLDALVNSFLYLNTPVPEHIQEGGVILMGSVDEDFLARLRLEKIPFITVHGSMAHDDHFGFGVDFAPVMEEIAGRLAGSGCRRIAFVGISDAELTGRNNINRQKYDLFTAALKRHGLPVLPELQLFCEHFMHCGYQAVKELLDSGAERPDAFFFASDILAPGVYKALHEAGLRVPDDVLAVGCDGQEIGNYILPELTTIEFDRYEIGRTAAAALADFLIGNKNIVSRNFPASLLERKSLAREVISGTINPQTKRKQERKYL